MRRRLWRLLFVLVPALAGAGLAAWLVSQRQAPTRAEDAAVAVPVMVLEAAVAPYVPRSVGHGEARPARVWRGIAKVAGTIVEKHPRLEDGAILPADTVLLRIDPTDYELAAADARAAMAAGEAQLAELEARRQATEAMLDLERQRLALAERELERKRSLLADGALPQAAVDQEEINALRQRQAVQDLENTLARLPAERRRLEAELERQRTLLAQARRNLEHTVIRAPFAMRVAGVEVEAGQHVTAGQTLVSGDDIAATEVEAQFPLDRFRRLIAPGRTITDLNDLPLEAEVRLDLGADAVRWPARVVGLSDVIDPQTRTIGVVVRVEKPYERARPPAQPPLVKGMYVAVELTAPAREGHVLLPRAAVHQGRVYIADERDRLDIREVTLADRQDGLVAVAEGVRPGERVVLTDLVPAVEGMTLAPAVDTEADQRLRAAANGGGTATQ